MRTHPDISYAEYCMKDNVSKQLKDKEKIQKIEKEEKQERNREYMVNTKNKTGKK